MSLRECVIVYVIVFSYLNQMSRFPSSATSKTFSIPPTSFVPRIITITTAKIIAENCSVSVHTTALNAGERAIRTQQTKA